jgi:hypothetical protein
MAKSNSTGAARSRKPKLAKFKPVFTKDEVFRMEEDYNEHWGVKRRPHFMDSDGVLEAA